MSVIYKSLKQVRKEEQERKRRPRPLSPEAVAPSYQRVLKRFAGYIVLVAAFSWVTMFWLQAEVRRIVAVTAEQVEAAAVVRQAAQEQPVQEAQEAMVEQVVVVSEVRRPIDRPIERMTPIVERRPAPPPPPPVPPARVPAPREPVELVTPTLELERHFSAQALRNNELLTLQRRAALGQQAPIETARAVEERLGPQSMFGLRLGGYEALKEGNFALAEDFFRQALARNPRDKATRMNLVLALIGQEKRQEARQLYDRLAMDYPLDEQVTALGRMVY